MDYLNEALKRIERLAEQYEELAVCPRGVDPDTVQLIFVPRPERKLHAVRAMAVRQACGVVRRLMAERDAGDAALPEASGCPESWLDRLSDAEYDEHEHPVDDEEDVDDDLG